MLFAPVTPAIMAKMPATARTKILPAGGRARNCWSALGLRRRLRLRAMAVPRELPELRRNWSLLLF